MKKIKQFRYYNDASPKNNPIGLKAQDLITGRAFNNYLPIIQLGVQGLPGTRFYVNESGNSIIVGYTGIYELDSNLVYSIRKLSFDSTSLNLIANSDNGYLLVDIVYEE